MAERGRGDEHGNRALGGGAPMTGPLPESGAAEETPRWRAWVMPLIGAALFIASILVLHGELQAVRYREVSAAFRSLPRGRVLLAFLLTVLNYLVLTGYDQLAFRFIGRTISRWRVALASFVGYAISNNVGWSILSGTSVRYRFYSRWGLTAGELSRIVVFYSSTFWLGLLALGGWSLAVVPHPGLLRLPGNAGARALGAAAFVVSVLYLGGVGAAAARGARGDPSPSAAARHRAVRPLLPRLGARRRRALRPPPAGSRAHLR
jgi:phosphatidylglycerol lysyltransferase